MPNRVVVCVATTPYYKQGMARLAGAIERQEHAEMLAAGETLSHWPTHAEKPYGFKAYALKEASERNYDTLLWADACMLPVQDMQPLWERIERDGYWMSRNGWTNAQWCADSWYADCFPGVPIEEARAMNAEISHVVATCFGISLRHPKGKAILGEYYRLASETKAFCGPWTNCAAGCDKHASHYTDPRYGVCGPAETLGHRHDQSCLSVIAHRLGCELTSPPDVFAYGKQGDPFDVKTIMIADGSY